MHTFWSVWGCFREFPELTDFWQGLALSTFFHDLHVSSDLLDFGRISNVLKRLDMSGKVSGGFQTFGRKVLNLSNFRLFDVGGGDGGQR